ncbi:MAG: InlB B-repeat-containing protein, partial [Verrucomicrobiota bacterium]
MKTKTFITSLSTLASGLLALTLLAAAPLAQAEVLLNDTFSDNARTTQNLPTTAAFYLRSSAASPNGINPTLNTSGGNITASSTTSSGSTIRDHYVAYFTAPGAARALAVGETMTLSVQVNASSFASTDATRQFRLGLFNSAHASFPTASPVGRYAADVASDSHGLDSASGSGASAADGYFVIYTLNVSGYSGNLGATVLSRATSAAASVTLYGPGSTGTANPTVTGVNTGAAAGSYATPGTPFNVTLKIYRNDSTHVTVTSTFGSYTSMANQVIASSEGGYTFDTLIISDYGSQGSLGSALAVSGGSYTLDNIGVQVTAPTTTTLTSSLNPSTYGNSVTFTATVNQSAASGTVTFMDGATTLGTGTTLSSGVSTYTTSALIGGTHSITAVYGGDGSYYATSTSSAVSQVVNFSVAYSTAGSTGGTAPSDGSSPYTANASVTVLGNSGSLVKSGGYAFGGWTTNSDGSGTVFSSGNTFTITANTTLYPKWLPTYTITYNDNGSTGGTVPTDSNTYTNNATVTVLGNTGSLVKTGNTFAGWTTNSDGSGTLFNAPNTFAMPAANTTLYAKWTVATTYTVTYNSNGSTGGTVPTDGNNYLSGATVTVLGNSGSLVKTAYTFTGWTTNGGGGTVFTVGNTFAMPAVNTTIYANWTLTPAITGAATATAFTTTYGTASTAQTFAISGANLTASITATAPTGFEVSSNGSSYGATATFPQSGGNASGTLSVRLAATATVSDSYNSQNIVLSSTGASSVNITTASTGNSVTAKALTVTGITATNKVYDGTTTASLLGLPTVLTPVTAVATSLMGAGTVPSSFYSGSDNIWNGNNLTQTGGATNILNWTHQTDPYGGGMWISYYDTHASITVNLGAAYTLNSIYLWNGTQTGAGAGGGWSRKVVTLEVTTSADGVTFGATNTLTLNSAAANAIEPTQVFPLTASGVQYVKLHVTSVNTGGDAASLSAVRFSGAASPPALVGVVSTDTANVTLATGSATGAFADANVGTAKTVTVNGL